MSFTASGAKLRQQAYILADGILATVTFDVSENETHKSTAKVTDHPIEEGANISDHVVVGPDLLTLVAWVSNTPIANEAELAVLSPQRAEEAYETLRLMKNAGTTCKVLTTLRAYTSMVITSISVPRNAPLGDAINVTVELQEIRTATSETIAAAAPRDARGSKSVDEGKKTTTDASAVVDAKANTILLDYLKDHSTNVERLTQ